VQGLQVLAPHQELVHRLVAQHTLSSARELTLEQAQDMEHLLVQQHTLTAPLELSKLAGEDKAHSLKRTAALPAAQHDLLSLEDLDHLKMPHYPEAFDTLPLVSICAQQTLV
jgi:hypothetical protein